MNTSKTKPVSSQKWSIAAAAGCCGGCLAVPVLLIGFLVLLLALEGHYFRPSAFFYGETYPVPPITLKPENEEWMQWLKNEENRALFEKENRSLFIGTWHIEEPYGACFARDNQGWEKTRLSILPDGTFMLTDPPEDLEHLNGFRGTLEGQWSIDVFDSWNLPYPLAIKYETGEGEPLLRWMVLWTTKRNDTDKKHLRLFLGPSADPDYPDHAYPAWKRVAEIE